MRCGENAMATLELNILDLHKKYAHLPESDRWATVKEIERRFYNFGLQYRPEAQLHEYSTWEVGIETGYGRNVHRRLVLSGIPDGVIHDAWAEILPALPEHDPEQGDTSTDEGDGDGAG
jgi:hypothetical protein